MTDSDGKSDIAVVPEKLPNKAAEPGAEAVEGRAVAKGNSDEGNVLRTQSREGTLSVLDRVRDVTTSRQNLR